jgi:type I restriction enzyme S subunit
MIENYAMGAAQPNISGVQIEKISCIIPTRELLYLFTSICDPFLKQISLLKTQNAQLRQIRDRLLPRLISGKLEVK